MVKQQKEFYEKWEKYGLAMIALPGYLSGQPDEEQKAAARIHIEKSRGMEGILDELVESGKVDMLKILAADVEQYKKYFSELTVEEALELLEKGTGYNKGYAPQILKYSKTSVKDLQEAAKKYNDAIEAYEGAKTEAEALKAFKEKKKYEEKAKVYQFVLECDRQRLKSHYPQDIAKETVYVMQRKMFNFDKDKKT